MREEWHEDRESGAEAMPSAPSPRLAGLCLLLQKERRNRRRIVRRLSMPSWLKLSTMRPKSGFGSVLVIGKSLAVAGSTSTKKSPSHAKLMSSGERSGWLKALFKSAPTSSRTLSVMLKNLRRPRFTPHVPGPVRKFRLAALGLSNASAPTLGTLNAAGLKNWSPLFIIGLAPEATL